jgi:hypothetical protein
VRNLQGRTRLSFWFPIFAAIALTGCQQTINYPSPTIATISPTSITAAQPTFTLTVTGFSFTPASTVGWSGASLSTIFVNINTLTAQVPASLIQNAGTSNITVTTPTPGGGMSLALTFTINPTVSPTPLISSTSPLSVTAGSGALTLDLTGANFVSQSVVSVGNTPLRTFFISTTSLQAIIPASDVTSAGTLQITVVNPANPAPGGGSSNVYAFSVTNPVPSLTSLSPTTVAAGGSTTQPLAVTGTGFVPTSVILFNGAARTTTANAAGTTVTAILNAADLAAGGVDLIQVMNPGPGGGTSNTLTFAIDPTDTAGLPILVDYAFDGSQASNGICGGLTNCQAGNLGLTVKNSGPSVSQTGEFVAFASASSNLVANQSNSNAESQIFIRDTCLGETCTPATFVVSTASTGGVSNGPSSEPSIDSTGTHVAYTSQATNLINYAVVSTNNRQVYWQPVCATGVATTTSTVPICTATTTSGSSSTINSDPAVLVSLGADGNAGNGDSFNPVISPDGQFVAFVSLATNLVSGVTVDGVTPQVYLRTICSGATPLQSTSAGSCVPTTYLVSSPEGLTPGNGPSSHPAIGNIGTFVSFVSTANNLLNVSNPNPLNPHPQEVFEQDECQLVTTGCVPTMALISTPDGTTPAGGVNSEPAISYDGRFTAFASTAANLGTASNGIQQIYVRDTCTGATTTCTPSTQLVSSVNGKTPANGLSENPSINGNSTGSGQFIAFSSVASNLFSNVANGVENVYVRNTCNALASTTTTTCAPLTSLVSVPAGTSPPAADGSSYAPSISGDGHVVGFLSFATDLVARDTNGFEDVFLAATSF